jgi:hypothetical protein
MRQIGRRLLSFNPAFRLAQNSLTNVLMTNRMENLDRTLRLVRALTESIEGLTLDEMAGEIGVTRRTVERTRDIIMRHFDLEDVMDGRTKRFRIKDSPGRAYTRPNAQEVAALQAVVDAGQRDGTPQSDGLRDLLSKIKASLDTRERQRLDNDLDLLTRLQRSRVAAGPAVIASPKDLTTVQGAILGGRCVEFEYRPDGAGSASWRRIVPYGLIHGPITYVLGKRPDRDDLPFLFRLDRMGDVRQAMFWAVRQMTGISMPGCPPVSGSGERTATTSCFACGPVRSSGPERGDFTPTSNSSRTAMSFWCGSIPAAFWNLPITCSRGLANW